MNANTMQIVPFAGCGKHIYYVFFSITCDFTDSHCNKLNFRITKA